MNTSTHSPRSSVPGLGKAVLVLTSLLACAPLSHASLLLQENFDNLTLGDLNGQNFWSADAALDVATGGLSYNPEGLSISIAGGSKHAVWSNANVQPLGSKAFVSQSGEVWFSLTIRVTEITNASRFWFYVSDDADLSDAGAIGNVDSNNTNLNSSSRIGSSQVAVSAPFTLPTNQTLFVVGRFSQSLTGGTSTAGDYDKMEMWVNPTSTSLGVAYTATNAEIASGIKTGIDTFALTALGSGSTVLWDNLLVGTTQADVLDVYAIPEPSTYAALVGLASLGLVTLRRRRG